jgi:hypothetical protein
MKYPSNRARVNGIVQEIVSKAVAYRYQNAYAFFAVYDPRRYIVDDEAFAMDCRVGDGTWVALIR